MFIFLYNVNFEPKMEFKDIKHFDHKSVCTNLINRHLKEFEELKTSNTKNKEKEFVLLRLKHELESNVYYFYKQLHNDSLTNKKNESLHGYVPIAEIDLKFKTKSIAGTVFVLHPDRDFDFFTKNKEFKLNTKNKIDNFYNILINAPLPFVFLPNCDLYEFNLFIQEIYENKDEFQKSMYSVKLGSKEVYFLEPLILTYLNLEFFCKRSNKRQKCVLLAIWLFELISIRKRICNKRKKYSTTP